MKTKSRKERKRRERERQGPIAVTNILAVRNSPRWYRSICFASTMPAGQSWPPHPDLRSSWSLTGSARRPEKSIAVVPAALYSGSGVSPSSNARGENSGDGDRCWSSITDRREGLVVVDAFECWGLGVEIVESCWALMHTHGCCVEVGPTLAGFLNPCLWEDELGHSCPPAQHQLPNFGDSFAKIVLANTTQTSSKIVTCAAHYRIVLYNASSSITVSATRFRDQLFSPTVVWEEMVEKAART